VAFAPLQIPDEWDDPIGIFVLASQNRHSLLAQRKYRDRLDGDVSVIRAWVLHLLIA
jgi:hypothetical protein